MYENKSYHEKCCTKPMYCKDVRRASEYEALASYFAFPCQNCGLGCPCRFPFGDDARSHQERCLYKPVECPYHETEVWLERKVSTTLQEMSFRLLFKGYHFWNKTGATHIAYYLAVKYGIVQIFQLKYDVEANQLSLAVVYLNSLLSGRSITCSVMLMPANSKTPCVQVELNTTIQANGISVDTDMCEQAELSAVLTILKTPIISCKWTTNLQELVDLIKCAECRIYMVISIFTCVNGHRTCAIVNHRKVAQHVQQR